MTILLVTLSMIFVAALALYAYKRLREIREERMSENEYAAAVTLWNYARLVKAEIDEAMLNRAGVLDFARISVPHAAGYRASIELAGRSFKVNAIPDKYDKTGRLSFFTDNSLTIRAGDHGGNFATEQDPEYEGKSRA